MSSIATKLRRKVKAAYRNVRGQMVLHARKDGNFDFIFKLQP